MALDPNVLAQLKPAAPQPTAMDRLAKLTNLQSMLQGNQLQQMQLQNLQSGQEKAALAKQHGEQIAKIFEDAGGDIEKAIPEILKIPNLDPANAKAYEDLLTSQRTARKTSADIASTEIDTKTKNATFADAEKLRLNKEGGYKDWLAQPEQAGLQDGPMARNRYEGYYKEITDKPTKDTKLDETYVKQADGKIHKFVMLQRSDNSTYSRDEGEAVAPPRADTPGVDEPFSPAVEAQRIAERQKIAAANHVDPTDIIDYSEGGINKKGIANKATGVIRELKTPTGGIAESKIPEAPSAVKTQADAAQASLLQVSNIEKILKEHPNITGVITGRFNEFMTGVGKNPFTDPKDAALAAQLQAHFKALFAQELRSMFPGRTNLTMQQAIEEVSAQMKDDPSILQGKLDAVKTNEGIVLSVAKGQGYDPDRYDNTAPNGQPTGGGGTAAGAKSLVLPPDIRAKLTGGGKP